MAQTVIHLHRLGDTAGLSQGPASKAVSNIRRIARSAAAAIVEIAVVGRAAVVNTSTSIILADTTITSIALSRGNSLLETVAKGGTGRAVPDHLRDLAGRARVDARAAAGAVVGLHEARVADAVVGRRGADAAFAFLHDYGQDEAVVYAGFAGDLVDCAFDVVDFCGGVVGAPAVILHVSVFVSRGVVIDWFGSSRLTRSSRRTFASVDSWRSKAGQRSPRRS